MKCSLNVAALVLLLPLLVTASPQRGGRNRNGGNGNANANNGNANANNGGGGGAAAASTSAAAASTATAAATGQAQTGQLSGDAQSSLSLDPSQVQSGLAQDGQAVQEAGQVPSATSTNNFINFCGTVPQLPLTNGQQVVTGSCNPTIMGVIVPKASMPSSKFTNPKNFDTIAPNTPFTISMAVNNLQTGNFVNPNTNYFAAPATTNGQGVLIGHSHVVVEPIASFQDTQPTNPLNFAFFKGLNNAAQGGVLTANVTAGLPEGFYRLASINTAANHQPALVAVAQHGSLDDAVYFQVTANGQAANGQGNGQAAANGQAANGQGANGQAANGQAANGQAANGQAGNGQAAANGQGNGQGAAAAAASSAAAAAATAATGQNKAGAQGGAAAAAAAAAAGQKGRKGRFRNGRKGRGRGRL